MIYTVALIRESLIGAAMGFAFGLFLLPARVAGEFLTQQIGLNISPQAGQTGTGDPLLRFRGVLPRLDPTGGPAPARSRPSTE